METIVGKLTQKIAVQKDDLLRDAIGNVIGSNDWLLSDIVGRVEARTYVSEPGITRFFMDGDLILQINDPVLKMVQDGLDYTMTCTQEYAVP